MHVPAPSGAHQRSERAGRNQSYTSLPFLAFHWRALAKTASSKTETDRGREREMLRGYALKGHSWLLARSGHDKKKLQRGVRAPCWSCWLVWLLWQSQQKWSLAQPLALGKPVWPVFLFQSTATLWPRCQDGLLRVCWWSGVRSPVGAHGLFFSFLFLLCALPGRQS